MNVFLKKEIRLLLPLFLGSCAVIFANVFLPGDLGGSWKDILWFVPMLVCPALGVMLALNSFGSEVSNGTLSNLLAQPMARLKIWQTKISLLALALLVLETGWLASLRVSLEPKPYHVWIFETFTVATLFSLSIFSGGLWTVLLLRQVAAAFWFTVLIPAMIAGGVGAFLGEYSGEFQEGAIASALGLYSLAGFFFARWLFFRAQDLQWSGGTIMMPEMRGLARFKSVGERRVWRPRIALWRKEFQLHQAQYVMAFVLLVLHLGVLAYRKFGPIEKRSDTELILQAFWMLWMVMPLLVGCAAVAEERKLGTLGGQLSLPASRRTQFAVKFITMLGLSLFFGAVMPLLLEGSRILPDAPKFFFDSARQEWLRQVPPGEADLWRMLAMFIRSLPILVFVGVPTVIGVLSFYASSLTRNTLQALGPAVLGCVGFFFLIVVSENLRSLDLDFLWDGQLHFYITLPLMFVALVWFAAKNFRELSADGKLWARNGVRLVLALAVSIAVTSAVYHRAWENLTPFEPAHGPAKISLANPAQMDVWWNEVNVRLPDGRMWNGIFDYLFYTAKPLDLLLANTKYSLHSQSYWPGSNWMTIRRVHREMVGVKTDGTLWISEAPAVLKSDSDIAWPWDESKMRNLVQYGDETDWRSAQPFNGYEALLLKNDGSLWELGTNYFNPDRNGLSPSLRSFAPTRATADAGWKDLKWNDVGQTLEKSDGSLWGTFMHMESTNLQPTVMVSSNVYYMKFYDGRHGEFRSTVLLHHYMDFKAGVCADGTFRIWADARIVDRGSRISDYYEWYPADVQIGSGTNWIAAAGKGEKIVTLKSDGTLWLWDFKPYPRLEIDWHAKTFERYIGDVVPVQLGSHSDWIAISGGDYDCTALAADGSVWHWPLMRASDLYFETGADDAKIEPLLDVSRKPQLLGNAFGATP